MGQVAILASLLSITVLSIALAKGDMGDKLDVNEYVSRYRARDLARNNGTGNSTYTNSSSLAWGEGYILMDYVMLYHVTKDFYWLDKVTQHFDQMIYGMTQDIPRTDFREFSATEVDALVSEMIKNVEDIDGIQRDDDGHPTWHVEYPGWYTDRYSVAYIILAGTDSETAKLLPASERISNIERAHQVSGHDYEIRFDDATHYTIRDFPLAESREFKVIAESQPTLDERITGIPGASFKIEGTPKAGDIFVIETVKPKPLQYVVHDGMVLYPIAQFIEIVVKDGGLQERFGEKAGSYIGLIKEVFARKWERYWVELDDNAGAYEFTDSPTERAPGRLLPHNQYNALCRAYLVLQDRNVTDDPILREEANKMVRYFKSNLKPTGNAWTWNYWDWGAGEDEHSGPEDSSHASINVGTAIEAYHRGIQFGGQDMVRLARTLLDQMWNGSMESLNIGDRVNTDQGDRYFHGRHWIELCEFDPKVWDVCLAWFKQKGEPADLIPSMLYAQQILSAPR
jgi:hypothetical protein